MQRRQESCATRMTVLGRVMVRKDRCRRRAATMSIMTSMVMPIATSIVVSIVSASVVAGGGRRRITIQHAVEA